MSTIALQTNCILVSLIEVIACPALFSYFLQGQIKMVEKWRFIFFIVTFMAVKATALKESGSTIGEYFNTSINASFMLRELTTKQGKIRSK